MTESDGWSNGASIARLMLMPRAPPPWIVGLSLTLRPPRPLPALGFGSFSGAPTTMFLMDMVATAWSCVLSMHAEMMKLSSWLDRMLDTRTGRGFASLWLNAMTVWNFSLSKSTSLILYLSANFV